MSDQFSRYESLTTTAPQLDTMGEISSRGTSLNRPGGILEYNVGADEGQASAGNYRSPAIQAGLGGVTTVSANGTQHSGAFTQFNTADFNGGATDFLATAKDATGFFPAMGNLTADSIVKYGGMGVTLGTLEAMGVVSKTATGYEVANGGSQSGNSSQPQHQQQQEQYFPGLPEGVEPLHPSVEAEVLQAVATVPTPLLDAAMAMALEKGIDGINFNDLGYQSGMTPGAARQAAETVAKAFSDQANSIVTSSGLEAPQEFYDWAAQHRPEEFSKARLDMAFGRNTSGLRALVNDYSRSVPADEGWLRSQGYEVQEGHDGESLVKIGGVWMTTLAAAQAGLDRRLK